MFMRSCGFWSVSLSAESIESSALGLSSYIWPLLLMLFPWLVLGGGIWRRLRASSLRCHSSSSSRLHVSRDISEFVNTVVFFHQKRNRMSWLPDKFYLLIIEKEYVVRKPKAVPSSEVVWLNVRCEKIIACYCMMMWWWCYNNWVALVWCLLSVLLRVCRRSWWWKTKSDGILPAVYIYFQVSFIYFSFLTSFS